MQFDQHKIFEILRFPHFLKKQETVEGLSMLDARLVKNIGNDVVHVINNTTSLFQLMCQVGVFALLVGLA